MIAVRRHALTYTLLIMCADMQSMPPTDAQVDQAVGTLAMLADPTRIRLLWALLDGELPVHDLAATAGCSATSASQHLAKLRLAGLVRHRRDGRQVLYRAEDAHVRRLLREALYHADHAVQKHPDHA
jgi:DNA-binding transcriptional ArsR family regulator